MRWRIRAASARLGFVSHACLFIVDVDGSGLFDPNITLYAAVPPGCTSKLIMIRSPVRDHDV
jgi:hypothetical protein